MITITSQLDLSAFYPWGSYARYAYNIIMREQKMQEFENLINEVCPNGISLSALNDWLEFGFDTICKAIDIEIE